MHGLPMTLYHINPELKYSGLSVYLFHGFALKRLKLFSNKAKKCCKFRFVIIIYSGTQRGAPKMVYITVGYRGDLFPREAAYKIWGTPDCQHSRRIRCGPMRSFLLKVPLGSHPLMH